MDKGVHPMNYSICLALRRFVVSSVAVVVLIPAAFCTTWIVDINNGPGTNFTNIQAAIAASAPGDVLIVRAGTYSPFTLSRGLSIIGQGTVTTSGHIFLNALPVGEVAILSNVQPFYSPPEVVQVDGCAGTVLLQNVAALLRVHNSVDVRVFRASSLTPGILGSSAFNGVEITDSRVQISESNLLGTDGEDDLNCSNAGEDGGNGIVCYGSSRVHLARSTTTGGIGGDGNALCASQAGQGGSGLIASGPIVGFCRVPLFDEVFRKVQFRK